MIKEFLDAIQQRFSDAFSWISDYFFLAEWYVLGFAILVTCLLLAWFFGAIPVIGKWIRAIGGVVVLLFGAFLAGMTVMFNHNRAKQAERKPKPREIETQPQWKWPWDQ